jgi:predicted secreted hydrolase
MRRAATLLALAAFAALAGAARFDTVVPGKALEFPRDAGAHPAYRIEWWYVTGELETRRGTLGFQVTFFRVANPDAQANPSRFSPAQLLFAHAALADPALGRLRHAERSARALEGLVGASTADTAVRIDDWSLERDGAGYRTRIAADDFAIDLALSPTQAPLLQGEDGFSRKGPGPGQASYYYSEPQLHATGRVVSGRESFDVHGIAWLDHEWSSEMLPDEAAGWDWLGANLEGGGALMAFRIRGRDGTTIWANAALREPGAAPLFAGRNDIRFRSRRSWTSPRTGTDYPIAMDVEIEGRLWRLDPLMDDQELDARTSTGTLYWEGAVRVQGPDGIQGRGYLELTGYAERLRL